jgi:hypothetical protein
MNDGKSSIKLAHKGIRDVECYLRFSKETCLGFLLDKKINKIKLLFVPRDFICLYSILQVLTCTFFCSAYFQTKK